MYIYILRSTSAVIHTIYTYTAYRSSLLYTSLNLQSCYSSHVSSYIHADRASLFLQYKYACMHICRSLDSWKRLSASASWPPHFLLSRLLRRREAATNAAAMTDIPTTHTVTTGMTRAEITITVTAGSDGGFNSSIAESLL